MTATAAPFLKVSKDEFFEFVQAQAEGKFEYEDGIIVQQMTGGTNRHALLIGRLQFVLMRALDQDEYAVTGQSRGVETRKTIRYPDILVERAGADLASLATTSPLVIVEVLSPSTEKLDLNVKSREYKSLPSLVAYVAARQDAAKCHVWQRRKDGAMPLRPKTFAGPAMTLPIDPLRITLDLGELYRGIA